MLIKHSFSGPLQLQDDHFWRIADLGFRHLNGAWQNYQQKQDHVWIKKIDNNDPRFGRGEFMDSREILMQCESEEYTQSIASTIFSHVWTLSAANYYRLTCKHKTPNTAPWIHIKPIEETATPARLAKALNASESLITIAEELHSYRNSILHLVEDDPKTVRIDKVDFPKAYIFARAAWVIHVRLLRHYDLIKSANSWPLLTRRYKLPISLAYVKKHHAQK